jgi:glycosyltransferase involved in cell wall biosynthesis
MLLQLPPPYHGAAISNKQVWESEYLHEKFDLTLLRLEFANSIADIGKFRIGKLLQLLKMVWKLSLALASRRYDAAYITLSPTGLAFIRDLSLVALLKIWRLKRIYHLRGKGIAEASKNALLLEFYRWAFSGAKVIHLSPLLYGDIEHLCKKQDVVYVPNGRPDPLATGDGVGSGLPSPNKNYEHGGIGEPVDERGGIKKILFLSNMVESKGALVLLEALRLVHLEGLEFEAHFVGDWPDAKLRDKFINRRRDWGLEAKIIDGDAVQGEDKRRLFAACDIFAFPTYFECFPGVVLEAMSWRQAVVASAEGAIPEILDNGKAGMLVPPKNAEALAEAISSLLKEPDKIDRLAGAARKRYEDEYTLEKFERHVEKALSACL